ncbi:hypothetical protein KCU90_g180, partial [Aureobasidium melanogenum]
LRTVGPDVRVGHVPKPEHLPQSEAWGIMQSGTHIIESASFSIIAPSSSGELASSNNAIASTTTRLVSQCYSLSPCH